MSGGGQGHSPPAPRWRGRIHAWAFVAAVPASLALLVKASGSTARVAAAVYGASLIAVFGISAAYHCLARSVTAKQRMRRLDHSTIFLLIAGTYTPVCLLALPPGWGIPLLVTVWVGAVTGILLKVAGGRFRHTADALYLILGWAALSVTPAIISHVSVAAIIMMMAGGVGYTLGAIVLFRRSPDPSPVHFGYHEIWHTCTVLAGAFHFVMVWMLAVDR